MKHAGMKNNGVNSEAAARVVELQEGSDRLKMELNNSLKQINELSNR